MCSRVRAGARERPAAWLLGVRGSFFAAFSPSGSGLRVSKEGSSLLVPTGHPSASSTRLHCLALPVLPCLQSGL